MSQYAYPSAGASGPWEADDDNVLMDGYLNFDGTLAGNNPTVDGIANRVREHPGKHGGMVRGHDGHLAHIRNTHRSPT